MQKIVIDKPYRFVPPYRHSFWSRVAGIGTDLSQPAIRHPLD